MRLRECLGWLWKTSKGFRLPAVLNGLIGILQVSVSLCFVWVCKYLIDIVPRHTKQSDTLTCSSSGVFWKAAGWEGKNSIREICSTVW